MTAWTAVAIVGTAQAAAPVAVALVRGHYAAKARQAKGSAS